MESIDTYIVGTSELSFDLVHLLFMKNVVKKLLKKVIALPSGSHMYEKFQINRAPKTESNLTCKIRLPLDRVRNG